VGVPCLEVTPVVVRSVLVVSRKSNELKNLINLADSLSVSIRRCGAKCWVSGLAGAVMAPILVSWGLLLGEELATR